MQNKDNDHLAKLQTVTDQKKQLEDKILEYETNESGREKHLLDLQNKMNDLLEDNDDLKQQVKQMNSGVKKVLEQEYLDQIAEMQKQLREVQSQNSEYKAKEIMNAMGGGSMGQMDDGVSGLLQGLGSLNNISVDNTEINKLKSELSGKTNEIL